MIELLNKETREELETLKSLRSPELMRLNEPVGVVEYSKPDGTKSIAVFTRADTRLH